MTKVLIPNKHPSGPPDHRRAEDGVVGTKSKWTEWGNHSPSSSSVRGPSNSVSRSNKPQSKNNTPSGTKK